mmetsp:Transcript_4575/g.15778  ORF Transcript_4575/g.15778 Transcript_4575/m.15778 type:complete len:271 (+) Transcript_4575:33-845(+)
MSEYPAGFNQQTAYSDQHERLGFGREVTTSQSQAAPGLLRGARVLLVEDEQLALKVGCAILAREGAMVVTAESGGRALELLGLDRECVLGAACSCRGCTAQMPPGPGAAFDICFLDGLLPECSGLALLQRLRQQEKAYPHQKRLPVVMLSAWASATSAHDFQASGAQAWIQKPLNQAKLQRTLGEMGLAPPSMPPPMSVPLHEPVKAAHPLLAHPPPPAAGTPWDSAGDDFNRHHQHLTQAQHAGAALFGHPPPPPPAPGAFGHDQLFGR